MRKGKSSSDNRTEGDWVNTPVPTARRGVRDGGLHGRPKRKGGNETHEEGGVGIRGEERTEEGHAPRGDVRGWGEKGSSQPGQ